MNKVKQILIFMVLWILTVFVVSQIGNFLLENIITNQGLNLLKISKEEFQNLIYNNAVLSFLFAYIGGKLYIQKKPENKQHKKIIYLLCYLLSFSLLFILIVSII